MAEASLRDAEKRAKPPGVDDVRPRSSLSFTPHNSRGFRQRGRVPRCVPLSPRVQLLRPGSATPWRQSTGPGLRRPRSFSLVPAPPATLQERVQAPQRQPAFTSISSAAISSHDGHHRREDLGGTSSRPARHARRPAGQAGRRLRHVRLHLQPSSRPGCSILVIWAFIVVVRSAPSCRACGGSLARLSLGCLWAPGPLASPSFRRCWGGGLRGRLGRWAPCAGSDAMQQGPCSSAARGGPRGLTPLALWRGLSASSPRQSGGPAPRSGWGCDVAWSSRGALSAAFSGGRVGQCFGGASRSCGPPRAVVVLCASPR